MPLLSRFNSNNYNNNPICTQNDTCRSLDPQPRWRWLVGWAANKQTVSFYFYCTPFSFSPRFLDFFLALPSALVSVALSLKFSFWMKFLREFRRSCMEEENTFRLCTLNDCYLNVYFTIDMSKKANNRLRDPASLVTMRGHATYLSTFWHICT